MAELALLLFPEELVRVVPLADLARAEPVVVVGVFRPEPLLPPALEEVVEGGLSVRHRLPGPGSVGAVSWTSTSLISSTKRE